MITQERINKLLEQTLFELEEKTPNSAMIKSNDKLSSRFARCLPVGLPYEEIAAVMKEFNERILYELRPEPRT